MAYRKRIADDLLKIKLKSKGATLIQGAKWCGKTTTAEQLASSVIYMNKIDTMEQNIALANIKPSKILEGETPRLIDEWQLAPRLWDAIRFEVDHRGKVGQFILTGSAVPAETKDVNHTGTGRFNWLTMRPMSLYESGESTGDVSLKSLFDNPEDIDGTSNIDLDDLAFLTCRGGWPFAIDMEKDIALLQAFDYYDGLVNSDINRADGVQKNLQRVKRLMRSLARNQGQQITTREIAKDVMSDESVTASEDTIASYINALKDIFAVEDMPAWNPNLRSKSAIRASDTRYFVDPSIATASLGLGPNDLINDLKTFGLIFETLCMRDLRVYADSLDGEVYHFRDRYGLECDAVVHLRNGHYGLIEVKLGGDKLIDEACESLKKVENAIDTDKMYKPSFKMVLVGFGKYPYKREDGIYVVPVGCLKN